MGAKSTLDQCGGGHHHREASHIGADDFFPALVYVVVQANPQNLHSTVNYIMRFRNPEALRLGAQGCFITHFKAAVVFLSTFKSESCAQGQHMEEAALGST